MAFLLFKNERIARNYKSGKKKGWSYDNFKKNKALYKNYRYIVDRGKSLYKQSLPSVPEERADTRLSKPVVKKVVNNAVEDRQLELVEKEAEFVQKENAFRKEKTELEMSVKKLAEELEKTNNELETSRNVQKIATDNIASASRRENTLRRKFAEVQQELEKREKEIKDLKDNKNEQKEEFKKIKDQYEEDLKDFETNKKKLNELDEMVSREKIGKQELQKELNRLQSNLNGKKV